MAGTSCRMWGCAATATARMMIMVQVIKTRELQGASLTFKPLGPVPNWSEYAPGLVGLLGFTDDQMVTFLTTGKDPSGKFARPPMPTYRLNRKDGTAMVSYLIFVR
jgi:hypothetical protein